MKLFNFYKPFWKHPVLVTSLALITPLVVATTLAEPTKEATCKKDYVGYIENFNCYASASCELTYSKKEIRIAPYLPLQADYEIKVLREDSWIEVKLKTGKLIRVDKNHSIVKETDKGDKTEKVPYTVPKDEEPFSPGFFDQIKKLLSYFEKLHRNTRNSSQTENKKEAETTETVSCETEPSPETNKTPNPEKTLEKIIGDEKGLTPEAKNTLLAGLLVMQKEGNWEKMEKAEMEKMEKNVLKLLKGMNYEKKDGEEVYYPAYLVKQELDKAKKQSGNAK